MSQSPAKAARRTVKRRKKRAQSRFGQESVLPVTREAVGELVEILTRVRPKEHGGLWHRYEAIQYAMSGALRLARDLDEHGENVDEQAT